MDLIIKISDDDVKELHDRYMGFSDALEGRILKAVANGTPLPKGHGDLVDTYTSDECWEIVITGEWIPVSERLPEERDWYLAVFKEKDTGFQLIPRVADYIGKGENKWRIIDEYGLCQEYRDKLECIAWIPLPESYKAESEVRDADKKYEAKIVNRGNCMLCGKELSEGEGIFFCKECEEKSKK